ncbi:MAG: hypothetical protein WCV72_00680 [Patescibacteria group bacterium]
MSDSFEKSEDTPNVELQLDALLYFHKGEHLRIGVRGSREYLEAILKYFRDKSFTIAETSISQLGNAFPVPQDISNAGYVVVVDSTGDWDNHTMNKELKTRTDLKISDQQNAVFVSWTQNKNETSGKGSEFDSSFLEI